MLNIRADRRFIPTDGRDKIPTSPKVLPRKVALTLGIDTRKMNRTLAFDVSNNLGHGILRRNRYQHVTMVRPQMPLFDPTLLVQGRLVKNFPKGRPMRQLT